MTGLVLGAIGGAIVADEHFERSPVLVERRANRPLAPSQPLVGWDDDADAQLAATHELD